MDAADLAQFIIANGIAAEIVHLSVETPTVETAAQAVGVTPDQIGKSVLFLAEGRPLLVIANGLARVDQRRLAAYLGLGRKRVKLANAEEVLAITGYPVGTVPPFGHREKLLTLVDAAVLSQHELYCGGGAINALLKMTVAELRRVVGQVENVTYGAAEA
ncbi:MAG: YbaK/EbsC family protein [Chloroflexota bacterium]